MKNKPDRKSSPLWASVTIAALAFLPTAALAQSGATPDVPTGLSLTATPTQIELACNTADVCSARSVAASVRTPVSTQPAQELQVSATGSGYGNVVSDPAGISCYMPRPDVMYLVAPDCAESYSSAQTVTLTARADSDSVFVGWRGACSGKSTTCTVAVKPSSVTAVGAYFMRPRVTADCVFDWAEAHFPSHLAPRAAITYSAARYHFRYYAGTDSYLGVSEDDLHIYFLKSGQTMVDLGDVSALAETAICK